MIELADLFDLADLAEMEKAGYVRRQIHPHGKLEILNYTAAAQYDRVWNDVTRQCRGLIVEGQRVVARPWPKFFNYGEHEQPVKYDLATHRKVYPPTDLHHALDLSAPVEVTDKMDGSLGILYPVDGEWAIATRGSFMSDQALTGTGLLRMTDGFEPLRAITYLFEIIYPENRIVVDYQGRTELVLLGGVVTDTGDVLGPDDFIWPGARAETFDYGTLAEALEAEPRPNREGVVVRFLDGSNLMVKIKQDDYVELHRLVTGMSERTVWEMLGAGQSADEICRPIPEEFWPWVREVAERLHAESAKRIAKAGLWHDHVLAGLPDGYTRKDYAVLAKATVPHDYLALCFLLLDGKPIAGPIWRSTKPVRPRTMVGYSEDTA